MRQYTPGSRRAAITMMKLIDPPAPIGSPPPGSVIIGSSGTTYGPDKLTMLDLVSEIIDRETGLPALLEAAKAILLDTLCAEPKSHGAVWEADVQFLRAAILKAEGGE
ncbi:hypothetical protein LCGC14_1807890 [marine sediment metagenome]|uniref:Uncharacterized protein n=1 Tax=marine sediment metagenome TaxID=412755 RepID=A0A0F9J2B2_9ZZZZ